MSEEHLDLLGLDAVRAGDATPEERAHADGCSQCREAVEGFRSLARGLAPAPLEIPPKVTRDILALARPRPIWRPLAAAAALLIGLGSLWVGLSRSRLSEGLARRPDRVDIVDAYDLALHLKAGERVDASWDLNGDGKVDSRDVDEIVRRSVAIR